MQAQIFRRHIQIDGALGRAQHVRRGQFQTLRSIRDDHQRLQFAGTLIHDNLMHRAERLIGSHRYGARLMRSAVVRCGVAGDGSSVAIRCSPRVLSSWFSHARRISAGSGGHRVFHRYALPRPLTQPHAVPRLCTIKRKRHAMLVVAAGEWVSGEQHGGIEIDIVEAAQPGDEMGRCGDAEP